MTKQSKKDLKSPKIQKQGQEESDNPKIGFSDFTCCEGCQLQIVNLEEKILDLIKQVQVVNFREVSSTRSQDYEIAFIEGSISSPEGEKRVKKIRENAETLVAFGSCATLGGINAIRNYKNFDEVMEEVYPEKPEILESWSKAKPVHQVVPVDYSLHGCPVDRKELSHLIESLLLGKEPDIPNYPVCVECKLNENICLFEKDIFCLGPITRAGGNSTCVNEGDKCWGCRGMIDNPNENAHKEVLEEYGLTVDEIKKQFNLYSIQNRKVKKE